MPQAEHRTPSDSAAGVVRAEPGPAADAAGSEDITAFVSIGLVVRLAGHAPVNGAELP